MKTHSNYSQSEENGHDREVGKCYNVFKLKFEE